MKHALQNGALAGEEEGVIGRCVCGWTTGHRFSSFAASAAFADHLERFPADDPPALTFAAVTAANVSRRDRWHKGGLTDWSVADWAVAMAGEAGKVCNAVKKLRRVEDEIANISDADRQLSTRAEAVAKIGEELADTFLYLNLLAVRLNIDLPAQIVAKFNATSERYGFPERL